MRTVDLDTLIYCPRCAHTVEAKFPDVFPPIMVCGACNRSLTFGQLTREVRRQGTAIIELNEQKRLCVAVLKGPLLRRLKLWRSHEPVSL